MTITTKRSLIALLLSLVLVVSLFTVGISATEATDAATGSVTEKVEEVTENVEDSSETKVESTSETKAESASETESETDTEAVDKSDAEAAQKTKKTLIINAVIIGVIIIIGVLVFIKFRVKLMEFFRSVKSELKKIVWSSKEQTRKGFLVVVVVTVIFAVGLLIIDLAFQQGISYLVKIFQ